MFSRKIILLIIGFLVLTLLIFFFLPGERKQFKTAHFTFIFSPGNDPAKIHELASALESNYARICNDLKTIPPVNIDVNVYAHRWRYIQATGNWLASGSIEGISKLHFLGQAWGESDHTKVAVHEFAHAVTLKLLIDNEPGSDSKSFDKKFAGFPNWLWEALSVYEANQFINPRTLPFLNNDSYPNIAELNARSKGGKIYKVGYTLIEFILHQFGQEKLIEFVKNYGNISKVLGVTEDKFFRDWYEFIKQKYLA